MRSKSIMNIKLYSLLILCCSIFLYGCQEKVNPKTNVDNTSSIVNFNGFIVNKSNKNTLLVAKEIDQDKIENYSLDELIEIASQKNGEDYNGMFFYVNDHIYSKAKIGQKVSIEYTGPVQESLPAKASIKKIEFIDEQ